MINPFTIHVLKIWKPIYYDYRNSDEIFFMFANNIFVQWIPFGVCGVDYQGSWNLRQGKIKSVTEMHTKTFFMVLLNYLSRPTYLVL